MKKITARGEMLIQSSTSGGGRKNNSPMLLVSEGSASRGEKKDNCFKKKFCS